MKQGYHQPKTFLEFYSTSLTTWGNHMSTTIRKATCLLLMLVISGASIQSAKSQNWGSNETGGAIFGTLLGGVIGGAIGGRGGGRIVGGIVGATVGGIIGGSIGRSLDEQERRQLAAMTRATASSGVGQSYRGKSGTISTRMTSEAGNCRTVEQEVVLNDGTKRTDSVQACHTAQGWKFG